MALNQKKCWANKSAAFSENILNLFVKKKERK